MTTFLIIWLLLGVVGVIIGGWYDYRETGEITLGEICCGVLCVLTGPLVFIHAIEHASDWVIVKKGKK